MKRILALALCLMILCPVALAENFVVYLDNPEDYSGFCMLIRDDGTPLVPEETYYNIYELTPEGTPAEERFYAAISNDVGIAYTPEKAEEIMYDFVDSRLALMNGAGKLLTGFDYEELEWANGYILFDLFDGQMGVGAMDTALNVVIEPKYAALRPLGEGRWLALAGEDKGRPRSFDEDHAYSSYALEVIEPDGGVRALGLHTEDIYFNVSAEGICAVTDVDEYDDLTVFIGPDGEMLFDRGFRYTDGFTGGHAVVEDEDAYGVIDRNGNFVVPAEYDFVNMTESRPCICVKGTAFAIYDPKTFDKLMEGEFAAAEDISVAALTADLVGVDVDGRSLVYKTDGTLLLDLPEGREIQMYGYTGETARLVEDTGGWPLYRSHLIDLEGNVRSDDYGTINDCRWQDGHGRFVAVRFDTYKDDDGNDAMDWSTGRSGVIDENGQTVVPNVYDELRMLSFDRFWVVQGDRSGIIDSSGKWYYEYSDYQMLMD